MLIGEKNSLSYLRHVSDHLLGIYKVQKPLMQGSTFAMPLFILTLPLLHALLLPGTHFICLTGACLKIILLWFENKGFSRSTGRNLIYVIRCMFRHMWHMHMQNSIAPFYYVTQSFYGTCYAPLFNSPQHCWYFSALFHLHILLYQLLSLEVLMLSWLI